MSVEPLLRGFWTEVCERRAIGKRFPARKDPQYQAIDYEISRNCQLRESQRNPDKDVQAPLLGILICISD